MKLERARTDALLARRHEEYERLGIEQEKLGRFQPLMVHSLTEETGHIYFHPQLITDLRTVHDFGKQVLVELGR